MYKIMSVESLMKTSEEGLFKFEQIRAGFEIDNTLIFEGITRELEASWQEKVTTLIRQTVFSTF